jgi:Fe-S oxidoreductase/nitrate reductase gamma subunit
MTPTREILWNIDLTGQIGVYAFLFLPFVLIAFGLARRVWMWRTGRPENRFDRMTDRVWGALRDSVMHGRIARRSTIYGGVMHLLIFWGFILLFIGTVIVLIEHDFTVPILGYSFFQGSFYLGYKAVMNTAGLMVIVGVLMAVYRRYILRPATVETAPDDVILLALLVVLVVQGFVVQALRLAVEQDPWASWSYVSYPMAALFQGLPEGTIRGLHTANWWSHMITTNIFLGYFAYSKMIHPFTSLTNVLFRRLQPLGKLERIRDIEEAESLGVARLEDFTWAQLMNVDACMHCGRCLEYCPTFQTNKPLRPRDLVLEVAGYMADRGGIFSGEVGQGAKSARFRAGAGPDRDLIGGVVTQAELWDCTTCGACMEHCPVYIEHVPLIVGMRQNLVLEQAEFPVEVTNVFNNMERLSSPYQFTPNQRTDWARRLEQPVREMADVAAAGEQVEVLFFVGCLGSFDSRNQRTTLALARILQQAGVNFAILGKEETCTGDPAKRIGNEYLAQMMAEQTVETLNQYSFKKIVTACPHCFNAIANEYPEIGGNYEVVHHSQLINELIGSGKIKLDPDSDMMRGKVTYHDPCYLGRYNKVYDEPREVVEALPGVELAEMRRNRNRSFCCGGGGGRMFMEETRGTRINQARVREAMDTGATMLAAACPFCMTMFEDGINGVGAEDRFQVRDIAELVYDAMIKSPKSAAGNGARESNGAIEEV